MSPRDLAPDLAPTSPPSASETTSPLAPSLKGGEVVSTSPRDLAPAASCPTCLQPIAPTGKRGRPRKYHEGCEPVRRKVRGGLTTAALVERTRADAAAVGAEPLTGSELLDPFAAAGLVERRGRTWVVLDPAILAGFGPDQGLGVKAEKKDLRLIQTGPRPAAPREAVAA